MLREKPVRENYHRQLKVISRDELSFFPPLIEVLYRQPHPLSRKSALICVAFLISILSWACLSKINVIASSQGKIVVSDGNRSIQPFENSTIKRVLVKEGDYVMKDRPLVEFDDTFARADYERLRDEISTSKIEFSVASVLLQKILEQKSQGMCRQEILENNVICLSRIDNEWAEISAKLAEMKTQIEERKASVDTIVRQIPTFEKSLPMAIQREGDYKSLTTKGFVSGYAVQDRTKERLQAESDLSTSYSRLDEARASVRSAQAIYESWLGAKRNSLNERKIEAQSKINQLVPQLAKADLSMRRMILRAPQSGHIHKIAFRGNGEIALATQPLMILVPDTKDLAVELSVKSADVGFVHPGQEVAIKLDAFPYTRYGYVYGNVSTILPEIQSDEHLGPIFIVKVKPKTSSLMVEDKQVDLSNGMTVVADIETGRRRVIDFVFEPIAQHVLESFHER
jgi:hemolysin D